MLAEHQVWLPQRGRVNSREIRFITPIKIVYMIQKKGKGPTVLSCSHESFLHWIKVNKAVKQAGGK